MLSDGGGEVGLTVRGHRLGSADGGGSARQGEESSVSGTEEVRVRSGMG